jgi:hypothetical protein
VHEAELLLDVLRCLHRVVEVFEQQGQQDTQEQADQQADQQVAAHVGLVGTTRHLGAVDDRDVVAADAAGDADFLVALQQAVVELAIGGDLALQDVVVDRAALQIEGLGLDLGELFAQQWVSCVSAESYSAFTVALMLPISTMICRSISAIWACSCFISG